VRQRRDLGPAEAERGVDPQQALRLPLAGAEQMLKVVDLAKDAPRVSGHQLALGRQPHAARGAVDQRHGQALLHRRQPLADGGSGDAEFAPRRRQTAGTGQRGEEAELGGLDRAGGGARHC
jgi:hypothetical protein